MSDPAPYLEMLVEGFCFRCGKPLGLVSWSAADYVWHKECADAEEETEDTYG